jgi:hypothetical protein
MKNLPSMNGGELSAHNMPAKAAEHPVQEV